MISFKISEIKDVLNATVIGDESVVINEIEHDSRKDVKGKLFVAIKGAAFDGHSFVTSVCESGAVAVLVEKECDVNIPQIIVDNSIKALGIIGKYVREKSKAKVVSITGTCGKTSVKEMTYSILSNMGNTVATKGNLNNDIGVPLTLLTIDRETEFAVVELGANHPGEIKYTVELAKPDVALINNVASAHLEGFGDINGVYKTKSEILDYVTTNNGIGIVNACDSFYSKWLEDYAEYNLLSFGVGKNATYYATDVKPTENGCFEFTLNTPNFVSSIKLRVPGVHNVSNAVAAAILSRQVGATEEHIVKGLETVEPSKGRFYVEKIGNIRLVDDAYNASVKSVESSLDTISLFEGKKVFVFGDMGELGKDEIALHQSIGEHAKGKVDSFISIGKLAKYSAEVFGSKCIFEDRNELKDYLLKLVTSGEKMTIAIKGSHGMHMEEFVKCIKEGLSKC